MLQVGDLFPEFDLTDENGHRWTRAELVGQPSVIYFYPKDDTSGCTVEACGFRDIMPSFQGARVFGVSPDDEKSHRKFIDKHGLNFTLLADKDHGLAEACGLWVEKSMYGRTYMGVDRTTYLLDAEGRIVRIWQKVKPQGHAEEVLAALQAK